MNANSTKSSPMMCESDEHSNSNNQIKIDENNELEYEKQEII